MKNKRKSMIVCALAAVMIVGSAATAFAATNSNQTDSSETTTQASDSSRHGKKEKVAEPDNAIGKDKAKSVALKDADVTEDKVEKVRVRVSKLDDGTVVYKVGFTFEDKYYSYKINALTGAVADKSEQSAEEHAASKKSHDISQGTKESTSAKSENA